MAKDTSGLSADNVFKNDATIKDVARTIQRLAAQLANTAGNLADTWIITNADIQNTLYGAITNGWNEVALDFQAWTNAPGTP